MRPPNEPHFTVTSSETGRTEYRRLLTEKQVQFDLELALMNCTAFSGTPRRGRDYVRKQIADAIVQKFRQSNLKVFGGFGEAGPMQIGNRKHLWKTDEEYEREQRSYEDAKGKKGGED